MVEKGFLQMKGGSLIAEKYYVSAPCTVIMCTAICIGVFFMSISILYVQEGNSTSTTVNKLVVASFGNLSNPGGSIKVVDILNQTVNDLGNERTSPYGGLDGIESDDTYGYYYVSDWPAGKVYLVNSSGTGFKDLVDLQTQGTADIEFIANKNILVIPLMQDNKLVSYMIR
jgi:hypothetical protein